MEVRMPQSPTGTTTAGTDLPLVWPHPDGDPRLKWPIMAPHFTSKRLLAWINDRRCLCGCRRQVKWLHQRPEDGQFSYFTNRCWPKLARQYKFVQEPSAPVRRDPAWLESVRRENQARLCSVEDTRWYVMLIEADVEARGITYRQWSVEKGFGPDWIYLVTRAAREGERITKYNAARILKALGEKVPEDLETRYQQRVRQTRKRERAQRQARARAAS